MIPRVVTAATESSAIELIERVDSFYHSAWEQLSLLVQQIGLVAVAFIGLFGVLIPVLFTLNNRRWVADLKGDISEQIRRQEEKAFAFQSAVNEQFRTREENIAHNFKRLTDEIDKQFNKRDFLLRDQGAELPLSFGHLNYAVYKKLGEEGFLVVALLSFLQATKRYYEIGKHSEAQQALEQVVRVCLPSMSGERLEEFEKTTLTSDANFKVLVHLLSSKPEEYAALLDRLKTEMDLAMRRKKQ